MRLLLLSVLLTLLISCQNETKKVNSPVAEANTAVAADSSNFTTIAWDSTERNFGNIKEGEKLEAVFVFKNTGDKPLIIQSAKASCGCTVAEYTKEPVAPGGSGEVKGVFDSQGKPGHQQKSIYVYANTKGSQSHDLIFNVEVLKKQ
jgi:Protein of unknown function (DUF1573)